MTPKSAAIELSDLLNGRDWFRMVGIGATESGDTLLIVYVSRKSRYITRVVPDVWRKFPVNIKVTSSARPAETASY